MKRKMKKFISMVLALAMIFGMTPQTTFAAGRADGTTRENAIEYDADDLVNFPQSPNEGYVKANKEAAWVAGVDNIAKVTLSLIGKGKMATSDVVLVIDQSGSMDNQIVTCSQPEHKHGDECYEITCGITEHKHSPEANCYNCNTNNDKNHKHKDKCTQKSVKCQIKEHTHKDNCSTLVCEIGHIHNNQCKTKKIDMAKTSARNFAKTVLASDELKKMNHVAIVSYSNSATTKVGLSNDLSAITNAINGIEADGGTNIQAGIAKAHDILKNSEATNKYILVLSDGEPTYSYEVTSVTNTENSDASEYNYPASNFRNKKGIDFGSEVRGTGGSYYLLYTVGDYWVTNNGFATVSQALIAKKDDIKIYSIGFDVKGESNAEDTMLGIASSPDHSFSAAGDLDDVFQAIAGKIAKAGQQAIVKDEMGHTADYNFTVIKDDVNYPINATQGTYTIDTPNKNITWSLGEESKGGDITETAAVLTYYVRLNTDKPLDKGTILDTNKEATVSYLNVENKWVEQYFQIPHLSTSGIVNIGYYLVNAQGNPINSAGTIIDFQNKVKVKDSESRDFEVGKELEVSTFATDIAGYRIFSEDAKNDKGETLGKNVRVGTLPVNLNFGYILDEKLDLKVIGDEWTYDGSTRRAKVNQFTAGATLTYNIDGGSTWTAVAPTFTDATKKAVKVSVKASKANCDDKIVEVSMKVNPVEIAIAPKDASKEYDGSPLVANECVLNGSFIGQEGIQSVVYKGAQTTVGEAKSGIESYELKDNTKADNYVITLGAGLLNVFNKTKRTITITADSATQVYNGKALTKSTWKEEGTLFASDSIEVKVEGSATNVADAGINEVKSFKIVNKDGKDVTDYYNVVKVSGKLTIKKAPLVVTADSDTQVYNGKALTQNTATANGLVNNDKLKSVTVIGSQTTVGHSDNTASEAKIYTEGVLGTGLLNVDVTANYDITYKTGTLTVTRASVKITIEANDNSKVYDGDALRAAGYKMTAGKLISGDEIGAVVVTGSQTDAGTSASTIINVLIKNNNQDVTENYNITYETGILTVSEREVVLTANSTTKQYDGEALIASGYTITKGSFVNGEALADVKVKGSQLLEGSSESNIVEPLSFVAGTKASNYNITCQPGVLTVTNETSIAITIKTGSATKTYDGKALTNGKTDVVGELGKGDKVSAIVNGTITDAGSAKNTIESIKVFHGFEDVTKYYKITEELGDLVVAKASVIVTAASSGRTYNGEAYTDNHFTYTGTVNGDKVESATVTGEIIYVGTANNIASEAVIKNIASGSANHNYTVSYIPGTLKIEKADIAITVTAPSVEKVYDGEALEDTVAIIGSGLMGQDKASATVSGSITNAGETANIVGDVIITNGVKDVTANYNVNKVNGLLKVNPRELTLKANDKTKVYDGTYLDADGFEVISGTKLAEHEINATVTGRIKYVSEEVASKVKDAVITAGSTDMSKNYSITYVYGTLTITPANIAIEVTAQSAEKVYDGTELTAGVASVEGALISGDVIDIKVKGSQTTAGESSNDIGEITITNNGINVSENYIVATHKGILKVTKRTITLTADSASQAYNGLPLTANGFTKTIEGEPLLSTHNIGATVTGTATYVADTVAGNNKIANAVITAGGSIVTDSFIVSYVPGTLSITPANMEITITAPGAIKVYDATPLNASPASITAGYLIDGDVINIEVAGTQIDVNVKATEPTLNKIVNVTINNVSTDVTENYIITKVEETLIVTPRPIKVIAASDSKVYDNAALTNGTYEVTGIENNVDSGLVAGDVVTAEVTGTITEIGNVDNIVSQNATIADEEQVNKTGNYNIEYVNGKLTIVSPTDLPYTVNYYKDSITDANFIGMVEGKADMGVSIYASNNTERPEGSKTFDVNAKLSEAPGYEIVNENKEVLLMGIDLTANLVNVIYTRKVASLTIEKTVSNLQDLPEGTEFHFQAVSKDGFDTRYATVEVTTNKEIVQVEETREVTETIMGEDGVETTETKQVIEMVEKEVSTNVIEPVTINGMEWGEYTVTEVVRDGNEYKELPAHFPYTVTGIGTITLGGAKLNATMQVTNTLRDGQTLVITKEVLGQTNSSDYEFEIYLNHAELGQETILIGGEVVSNIELTPIDKDGETVGYKFTLNAGESLIINNLPTDTNYRVNETNSQNATEVKTVGNTEGMLDATLGASVKFINIFKTLTINKVYSGRVYDQAVVIDIFDRANDTLVTTVELNSGEAKTIALPGNGTYYVVEHEVNRYEASYTNDVVISDEMHGGAITVTNKYKVLIIDDEEDPIPPTTDPTEPEIIIDPETPLAGSETGTGTEDEIVIDTPAIKPEDILDEDTPLTSPEEIVDENTPLAIPPKTSDNMSGLASILLAALLLAVSKLRKKEVE